MKLSFVIVTYKRGDLLQTCLKSIYQQANLPRPYEIVIIDNGGDAAIIPPNDSYIQIRLERPQNNLGAAGGRNLGMKVAKGEIMVFIDDDAEWHQPEDVSHILQLMETYPKCGVVAMHSLHPNTHAPIMTEFPHPSKTFLLGVTRPTEIPYFYAYGNALRTEVLGITGGYPERFGIYAEELDLSLRIIEAGYSILYDPQLAVYHHKSNLGRPVQGDNFWRVNTLNKSRMAWRLLPYPYPITTLLAWSFRTLYKTQKPSLVFKVWRDLWGERKLLRQERKPIHRETVRYLKKIGARLWY
ncbi:MAG: glycosyltransferase family 2 protein [Chloroflexi bacterium]|nr:glycosyltransferase family 2 protein [Chloroflexota bacterium]